MSTEAGPRTPGVHRAAAGEAFFRIEAIPTVPAGPTYSPGIARCVEGECSMVALVRIPGGTRAMPHSHPNEQWTLILEGRGFHNCYGETVATAPFGLVYDAPGAIHHGWSEDPGQDVVFFTAKDTSHGLHGIRDPDAGAGAAAQAAAARAAGCNLPATVAGARRVQPGEHFFALPGLEAAPLGPPGSEVRGRLMEGERTTLALADLPAGARCPAHAHAEEEWIYILAGSGSVSVGEDRREASPGLLVRIAPGTVHDIAADAAMRFVSVKDKRNI
jgi:quercetin dioxygenase-like cupin family protein